jgi:hypothetical protein
VDTRSVTERVVSSAGDPFLLVAPALAEMTPSKRERIIREHYGRQYRHEVRRLALLGHLDSERMSDSSEEGEDEHGS